MKHSNWPVYDFAYTQALLAKIKNIRPGATVNGSHICTVECPNCQDSRTLTYGGWSAIVCGSCRATLYRNRRSMESDNG